MTKLRQQLGQLPIDKFTLFIETVETLDKKIVILHLLKAPLKQMVNLDSPPL